MNLLSTRDPLAAQAPARECADRPTRASGRPPAGGTTGRAEHPLLAQSVFDPDRAVQLARAEDPLPLDARRSWSSPRWRCWRRWRVSWANRDELVSRFADVLSWETFFLAWLALVVATTCTSSPTG